MPIYDTLSLPDDGKSIRLLDINPGSHTDQTLYCQVRVAQLNSELQYEALSYTWGDPLDTTTIYVNDIELAITKSLAKALFSLRSKTSTRTLWIDQICINQRDLAEKTFQIPLMAPIYRGCIQTVIWLGESDENSNKIITVLTADRPKVLSDADSFRFLHLLSRPWFRRIWIIQELALAPKAIIRCGDDAIPWELLSRHIAQLVGNRGAGDLFSKRAHGLHSASLSPELEATVLSRHPAYYAGILNFVRKSIQTGKLFGMRPALRLFHAFEATVPSDKVFGLLGLILPAEQVAIRYDFHPQELYQRMAYHIIRRGRSLRLFLDCVQTTEDSKVKFLPSWVPDWSASQPLGDTVAGSAWTMERFHASRHIRLTKVSTTLGGVLKLEGQFLGTIAALGDPIPHMSQFQKVDYGRFSNRKLRAATRAAIATLDSWRRVVRERDNHKLSWGDKYFTGETILEVYYHTLLATGGPPPSLQGDRRFHIMIKRNELDISIEKHVHGPFNLLLQYTPKTIWMFVYMPLFFIFMSVEFCVEIMFIFWAIFYWDTTPATRDLTKVFRIALGMHTIDASRQTWVVGCMDCGLIGRFPAPDWMSKYTVPSRVGDSVVTFKGGSRPFVLRRVGERWRLIGNAYVHGVMFGAAFQEAACQEFELV